MEIPKHEFVMSTQQDMADKRCTRCGHREFAEPHLVFNVDAEGHREIPVKIGSNFQQFNFNPIPPEETPKRNCIVHGEWQGFGMCPRCGPNIAVLAAAC